MDTVRLTTAQAIVRYLVAQRTVVDGRRGAAVPRRLRDLRARQRHRPRARAGRGRARASRRGAGRTSRAWRSRRSPSPRRCGGGRSWSPRRRSGPARRTWSPPPASRWPTGCPLLLLSGDTFQSRVPDPVLQQVEHFGAPSTTVNDAFRAVTRYWDRIVHPAQVVQQPARRRSRRCSTRPTAGRRSSACPRTSRRRPTTIPAGSSSRACTSCARPRPDRRELAAAAAALRGGAAPAAHRRRRRPLLARRGRARARSPSATTSRSSRRWPARPACSADHPRYAGPIGVTGCDHANRVAAEADVVLAVGTRLQDFTTGSWTVFDEATRIVALNTARFDAMKHLSLPLVGDAREASPSSRRRSATGAPTDEWTARAEDEAAPSDVRRRAHAAGDARRDPDLRAGRRRDQPPGEPTTTTR